MLIILTVSAHTSNIVVTIVATVSMNTETQDAVTMAALFLDSCDNVLVTASFIKIKLELK